MAASLASENLVVSEADINASVNVKTNWLLVRDSLRVLQRGDYSDIAMVCGQTVWMVQRRIVFPRSAYLYGKTDPRGTQYGEVAQRRDVRLDENEHNVHVIDAYLVWLYTRSFPLIKEVINASFEEDALFGFMAFYRFAVKSNSPRRGFDNESDNHEIITLLGDWILRLLDNEVETFLSTHPDPRESSTSHAENVAQAVQALGHIASGVQGNNPMEAKRLKDSFMTGVASSDWLKLTNRRERLHRFLAVRPTSKMQEGLDRLLVTIKNEGLEVIT